MGLEQNAISSNLERDKYNLGRRIGLVAISSDLEGVSVIYSYLEGVSVIYSFFFNWSTCKNAPKHF